MRRLLSGTVVWLVLAGLYLVLAGTADAVEVACATVAASLAAGLGVAMALIDERRFTVSFPAKAVLRPLASLLPDLIAVGRVLLAIGSPRDHRGCLVHQPFHSGGAEGRSTFRRAVSIIGVSLAPRTFVVRGEDSDELLLHCLPEKAPSPDRVWPA